MVIVQHGNRLTAQSLPGASSNPDSPLTLDLTVDRNVVTGSWVEQTASDGYYNGARYHGAIQLLVEPTGRRTVADRARGWSLAWALAVVGPYRPGQFALDRPQSADRQLVREPSGRRPLHAGACEIADEDNLHRQESTCPVNRTSGSSSLSALRSRLHWSSKSWTPANPIPTASASLHRAGPDHSISARRSNRISSAASSSLGATARPDIRLNSSPHLRGQRPSARCSSTCGSPRPRPNWNTHATSNHVDIQSLSDIQTHR